MSNPRWDHQPEALTAIGAITQRMEAVCAGAVSVEEAVIRLAVQPDSERGLDAILAVAMVHYKRLIASLINTVSVAATQCQSSHLRESAARVLLDMLASLGDNAAVTVVRSHLAVQGARYESALDTLPYYGIIHHLSRLVAELEECARYSFGQLPDIYQQQLRVFPGLYGFLTGQPEGQKGTF
jgi:hypothetical protein